MTLFTRNLILLIKRFNLLFVFLLSIYGTKIKIILKERTNTSWKQHTSLFNYYLKFLVLCYILLILLRLKVYLILHLTLLESNLWFRILRRMNSISHLIVDSNFERSNYSEKNYCEVVDLFNNNSERIRLIFKIIFIALMSPLINFFFNILLIFKL